jgi:NFU1 iron-sulfur cluster scaffold homolog, mitochondrial
VFYGKDYVTVSKKDDIDWKVLKPEILEVITDHYTKSEPLFSEDLPPEDTLINDDDSESV